MKKFYNKPKKGRVPKIKSKMKGIKEKGVITAMEKLKPFDDDERDNFIEIEKGHFLVTGIIRKGKTRRTNDEQ